MKASLLLKLFAAITVVGTASVSAQTLYWDPLSGGGAGSGIGDGDWLATGVWSTIPARTDSTTWVNDGTRTADFNRNAAGGPASSGTATVNFFDVVNADAILVNSNGQANTYGVRFADGTSTLNANSATITAGTLSFSQTPSANVNFNLGSVSGAGTLTLAKDGGSNSNFTMTMTGDVSAQATLSGLGASSTGLVGFVGNHASTAVISGGIVDTGLNAATAYLGATTSMSLKLASAFTGTGSSTGTGAKPVQIGSAANVGTVELVTGGSISKDLRVAGGTFLVSSALGSELITVGAGGPLTASSPRMTLNGSNVIDPDTSLTLNGGILAVNGTTDNVFGSLTLTATSAIDFSGANGKVTFGMVNPTTWTPGAQLQIWNWNQNVDYLIAQAVGGSFPAGFYTDPGTYDGQVSPRITFYTDNGQTLFSDVYTSGGWNETGGQNFAGTLGLPGEIVPVPEPTAVLSSILLVLAIGWRERGLFARRRTMVA